MVQVQEGIARNGKLQSIWCCPMVVLLLSALESGEVGGTTWGTALSIAARLPVGRQAKRRIYTAQAGGQGDAENGFGMHSRARLGRVIAGTGRGWQRAVETREARSAAVFKVERGGSSRVDRVCPKALTAQVEKCRCH